MFFRLIKQERRSKAALAAVFAMALMAAGCSSAAPAAEETVVEQQVTVIKTEAAATHSMGDPREQVAEVSASVRLDIPTMASGKIARVLKNNGDTVQKGEAIIQLESNLAVLDRKRAETSLSAAEQSLVKAKQDIASSRSTLLNNIANLETQYIQASAGDDQNLIDAARRNLESAKQQLADLDNGSSLSGLQSQIDAARLAVEQADIQLDSYQITAPASGTITDFAVSEGMTINAGTVVAVVQNVKQISIKTELSEPAAELARGKSELVYYNSENPSVKKKAKVVYLASVPNAKTRMYALELTTDNADGSLKPGSRVQVELTTVAEENVIAVPSLSIVREGSETFVMLSNAGTAEKRAVKLGRINGVYQEVIEGLKEGETVVVSGQHTLSDGQKIENEEAAKQS
ncbi:RND family efflux transporter, MFP subunit [Paenibacillus algorifonticola]|uniref:RND family efflux transporter, MFP subunit n=1 Tax=Paenibacillus algorifonticola TaxID=684063 RepID=A0A1I2IWD4_9BACL|nr:efflux RND transporter periplasmic adaptor subunit [Paenibacillus algorifonticola]SFF46499.1 RND family efflux transporter, MFP subunit [Paenibacillus algorifonticola]